MKKYNCIEVSGISEPYGDTVWVCLLLNGNEIMHATVDREPTAMMEDVKRMIEEIGFNIIGYCETGEKKYMIVEPTTKGRRR